VRFLVLEFCVEDHSVIEGLVGGVEVALVGIDLILFRLDVLEVLVDVGERAVVGEVHVVETQLRAVVLAFSQHLLNLIALQLCQLLFKIHTRPLRLGPLFLQLILQPIDPGKLLIIRVQQVLDGFPCHLDVVVTDLELILGLLEFSVERVFFLLDFLHVDVGCDVLVDDVLGGDYL